jgi:uncharacterized protein YprB with RNaseH-like and TPR domain
LLTQFNQLLQMHSLVVSYNGSKFDLPFIQHRSALYNIDIRLHNYTHLDVLCWVKNHSMIPKGCRSLKQTAR